MFHGCQLLKFNTFVAYQHNVFYRWNEVEEESGVKLVHMTGGVQFARKGEMDNVIDQYATAMNANNIKLVYNPDFELKTL